MCEPSFDYVDTLTSETYLRRRFVHEAIPLHDGLFGIARQLTSNVVDAEDLVQRTMVKAYSRFRPIGRIPTSTTARGTTARHRMGDMRRRHTSSANYRVRRLPMIVCASHDPFPDYLDRVRDVLDAAC
ncbi:MAG: hypothetical protein QOD02_4932 [Mycobacterium sp.]|nr:hypothetical protein [Mycobacterium sp.]